MLLDFAIQRGSECFRLQRYHLVCLHNHMIISDLEYYSGKCWSNACACRSNVERCHVWPPRPQIARKYGMTPSQLALAWCRSRWFVASTIIGATSVGQLAENLKAFELTLTKECLDDIAAVYKRYRDPAIL